MKTEADELLRNAIDMHCHPYPDVSLDCRNFKDNVDTLQLACNAGMRGIVFKGQIWPTTGVVCELQKLFPDISIFSSITLNATVGGIKPWVIEAAAKQGAKVVWMPTWCTEDKIKAGWAGAHPHMRKHLPTLQQYYEREEGIRITNARGRLTDEILEVVKMVKDFDMVLCTGHISVGDSLALAEECQRIGLKKLIWTHPFGRGTPPPEVVKTMVDFGAYVEFCALHTIIVSRLSRMHPTEAAKAIQEIGCERCLLTSDSFMEWAPPSPEFLKMFVVMLLDLAIPAQAIKVMIQDNPAKILGLGLIGKQSLDVGDE